MAGGSQIIIDKNGITLITPGKMESKAGQHKFESGERVSAVTNNLPQPICIECLIKAAVEGSGILRR